MTGDTQEKKGFWQYFVSSGDGTISAWEYFWKHALQKLPLYLKIEFAMCYAGISSYFTGLFFGDRLGNPQLFSVCITLVCLGLLMVSTVDYSGKVSKQFMFLWIVIGLISGIGLSTGYYFLS